MTPAELTDELRRLAGLLDQANTAVRDRGRQMAEAERAYPRRARAHAWIEASDGTAQERKDMVDAMTADERYARDLAESDHRSAWEAVRNYRTQISAMQTIAGVERETAGLAATGPQEGP